jgi:hypothetical protein
MNSAYYEAARYSLVQKLQLFGFGLSIRKGTPVGLMCIATNFAGTVAEAFVALWITRHLR